MDNIILNGVNSNSITGLMIQALPPISKPRIRTAVEEIDGRDGDIITKLGYAAYDRTVKIGLRGNFNMPEIVSFFNSEGEAIFSNEPEMVYNYTIVNQIDFNKLIRFREADVVFHVQPFKLSATETPITAVSSRQIPILGSGTVESGSLTAVFSNISATITGDFSNQASAAFSFVLPEPVHLAAGSYRLYYMARGISGFQAAIQLADSNGNNLSGDGISFSADVTSRSSYSITIEGSGFDVGMVKINLTKTQTIDNISALIYLDLQSGTSNYFDLSVTNAGNVPARPIITVYGFGNEYVHLNGSRILVAALGNSEEYITMDCQNMESYKGSTLDLKNRLVTGDYSEMAIPPGQNTLRFYGSFNHVVIENYSRWI